MALLRSPLCPTSLRSVRVSASALAALLLCLVSMTLVPGASAQDASTPGSLLPGSSTQGLSSQDQTAQGAAAQGPISLLHFAPRPPKPPKKPAPPSNQPMLVQATEIKYDYTNNSVAAVGSVQIYYGGATIEADQVIYETDRPLTA